MPQDYSDLSRSWVWRNGRTIVGVVRTSSGNGKKQLTRIRNHERIPSLKCCRVEPPKVIRWMQSLGSFPRQHRRLGCPIQQYFLPSIPPHESLQQKVILTSCSTSPSNPQSIFSANIANMNRYEWYVFSCYLGWMPVVASEVSS